MEGLIFFSLMGAAIILGLYMRQQDKKSGKIVISSSEIDNLWSGQVVNKLDKAVKDPVGLSKDDAMMNAMANVMGYQTNNLIRTHSINGKVVGVWVKNFPGNTTKKNFLSMYCSAKKKEPGIDVGLTGWDEASFASLNGDFMIYRNIDGPGFNVRFH